MDLNATERKQGDAPWHWTNSCLSVDPNCAVPEISISISMEGHWKFLGEVGS